MRFLSLLLLAGAALANPLAELRARALNPSQSSSCSASYTSACRSTLLSSASTFCASLGYGTTVNTVRTTTTINRTVLSTLTTTVGTLTITARPVTTSSTTMHTTMITRTTIISITSTVTQQVVDSVTGTIDSCPTYAPSQTAQAPVSTLSGPQSLSTVTTSSVSTSTSQLQDVTSLPPTTSSTVSPSITTAPTVSCQNPSTTAFTNSGTVTGYQYCAGYGYVARTEDLTYYSTMSLDLPACAARCTGSCHEFNYVPANPFLCEIHGAPATSEDPTVSYWSYYRAYTTFGVNVAATTTSSSSVTPTRTSSPVAAATTCVKATPTCANSGFIGSDTSQSTQADLNDPASVASVEGCALACRNFQDSGAIGSSGQPGCSSFYVKVGSFCQLNMLSTSQVNFRPDSSSPYVGADLTCFQCGSSAPPTTTTTSSTPTIATTSTIATTCLQATPTCGAKKGYVGGNYYPAFQVDLFDQASIASVEGCALACRKYQDSGTIGNSGQPGCASFQVNVGSFCELSRSTLSQISFRFDDSSSYVGADLACFQCQGTSQGTTSSLTTTTSTSTVGVALKERQAGPVKPACLRATNAAQTTAACNCVIPSSTTTVRSTSTAAVTSLRTVITTNKVTVTITSTPTVTSTIPQTTTISRTRKVTTYVLTTTTQRSTSTVTWALAATPSAFYIVDADMAFAEWPADADEIYYHVQYDFDVTNDAYAPTVFTLTGSNSDELRVANLEDNNGPAEGYLVAGQTYSGPGLQLVAQADVGGLAVPACQIRVTPDGTCPLYCNAGTNDVNGRDTDGLWSLLPHGTDGGFQNFVMAADQDLEDDSGLQTTSVITASSTTSPPPATTPPVTTTMFLAETPIPFGGSVSTTTINTLIQPTSAR